MATENPNPNALCVAGDPGCAPEQRCAACQRHDEVLAAALTTLRGAPAELPPSLAQRLRAIPESDEKQQRRLHRYLSALAAAQDPLGERDPVPVDDTVSATERADERNVDQRLSRGLAAARQDSPLPLALHRRLLQIPARQPTPRRLWWARDGQVAAAACLCLTLFATLWVGDASAALQAESPLQEKRREWSARGQEWVANFATDVVNDAGEFWQRRASRWAHLEEDWRARAFDRVREIRNTELGRRLAGLAFRQGADDEPQS